VEKRRSLRWKKIVMEEGSTVDEWGIENIEEDELGVKK